MSFNRASIVNHQKIGPNPTTRRQPNSYLLPFLLHRSRTLQIMNSSSLFVIDFIYPLSIIFHSSVIRNRTAMVTTAQLYLPMTRLTSTLASYDESVAHTCGMRRLLCVCRPLVVGLVLLSAKSVQFVIQLRRSEQSRISRLATVISVLSLFTSTCQYVDQVHTQKATRMVAACVHENPTAHSGCSSAC